MRRGPEGYEYIDRLQTAAKLNKAWAVYMPLGMYHTLCTNLAAVEDQSC